MFVCMSHVPQNQFIFIHDVILESVTCGDTQINSSDLRSTMVRMKRMHKNTGKTAFKIQFEVCINVHVHAIYQNTKSSHTSQILNQVTPNPSEVKVQTATQNKNMNRSMNFLPRKYVNY